MYQENCITEERYSQDSLEQLYQYAQTAMIDTECANCTRGHECEVCMVGIDSDLLDFVGIAQMLEEHPPQ